MIDESQKFAKMDKKIKEQAEAKLALERLAYSLRSGNYDLFDQQIYSHF